MTRFYVLERVLDCEPDYFYVRAVDYHHDGIAIIDTFSCGPLVRAAAERMMDRLNRREIQISQLTEEAAACH